MKKLEKNIIGRVYKIETKRTISYFLSRLVSFLILAFVVWFLASIVLDILTEQGSFDLLELIDADNLMVFYQESPKELLLILFLVIIFLAYLIFMVVKNYGKIKNKLVSIYKFYKKP